jgi:hypothetical protein
VARTVLSSVRGLEGTLAHRAALVCKREYGPIDAAAADQARISGPAIESLRLNDFFEPPPKAIVPEPQRYRIPPWFGAPRGTLPGVVALERVLARTDKVAVCLTRLAAYPTGFEFDVLTMTADDQEDLDPLMFHHHHQMHRGMTDEIPPELLRFGVQFSDGSKATNTGGFHNDQNPPEGPIMHPGGGGGGGGSWRQTQWVWPLPSPGRLEIVCEWPALDVPLTRSELDAQLILDAATRAQVIFSDEHLPEPPDEGNGPSAVTFIR